MDYFALRRDLLAVIEQHCSSKIAVPAAFIATDVVLAVRDQIKNGCGRGTPLAALALFTASRTIWEKGMPMSEPEIVAEEFRNSVRTGEPR